MINLASFFTTQVPDTSQIGSGQLTQIPGNLNGDSTAPNEGGFGVFELLLAQIEEQIANGDEAPEFITSQKDGVLQSDNPLLEKDPTLELVKILAGNDAIAEDVAQLDEIVGLDLLQEIEQTLALNQQVFDNIIEAGTGNDDLQIDPETGEIIVPDVAETLNIAKIVQPVSVDNVTDFIGELDLSTLNLTPEQVTLVKNIQEGVVPTESQAKQVQEIVETIVTGLVAIVAPPVKQSQDITIPPQAIKNAGNSDGDIASRLNGLVVGEADERPVSPLPFSSSDGAEVDGDFDQLLRAAQGKQYAGNTAANGEGVVAKTNPNAQAPANPAPQIVANVLQTWPFGTAGSLFSSAGFSDQIAEQLGLSLNGQQSVVQGSLTALVNQAQAASQPHPATQMVAASINKSAINGDTNLSLRLDPPDLGRVDVRMTFGKDKTVKAVVTAEKPETYLMLQRDAQTLERALQEAGLDADGGLSFELAEHGFDFDQQNQRGGGHDNGGTGGSDIADDLDVLETTMTWSVDPETGHTRYDIWA